VTDLQRTGRPLAPRSEVAAPELDSRFVDAVARRVLQLIDGTYYREGQLLTVAQVAHQFQVHTSWVYGNARRLGAVRLGDGPRAPLRFDPRHVALALQDEARMTSPSSHPPQDAPTDRVSAPPRSRGLLPIAES
jgi:hypothetical protein